MDRLLYISAVGLANIERAQTAHANNLANVSTNGFRADLARVTASEVSGDVYRARVYGVNEGAGVDLRPGPQNSTENPMDVAINGDGFFALALPDGGEAYTREGGFQVDNAGRLVDERGLQVMGRAGPISLPPFEKIVFGADGTITVLPQGQGPDGLVQVDALKIVKPEPAEIYKDASGLLMAHSGVPLPPAPDARVVAGFLEGSNVNAVHELTSILTLARQFELEVRMMKVAETNDEAASQLLRIG